MTSYIGKRVYILYGGEDGQFNKSEYYRAYIIAQKYPPFSGWAMEDMYIIQYYEPETGTEEFFRLSEEDFELYE